MPIHKQNGGYQWGHQKVYKGPGAKAKAEKQQAAIYANGYREEQLDPGHSSVGENTLINGQVTPPVRQPPQKLNDKKLFPAPAAPPK